MPEPPCDADVPAPELLVAQPMPPKRSKPCPPKEVIHLGPKPCNPNEPLNYKPEMEVTGRNLTVIDAELTNGAHDFSALFGIVLTLAFVLM